MAHSHCSVKWHVEVLEPWAKELLKSKVKMRKSSPSTYILLAILQLAGYLYSVTRHATQTCFDFFAVIGILGVCWPNFNSRKPTRHLYPVVITFHFLYYQYEQNSVREPIQSSNLLQHLICKSFQSKCLCLFSHRKN